MDQISEEKEEFVGMFQASTRDNDDHDEGVTDHVTADLGARQEAVVDESSHVCLF